MKEKYHKVSLLEKNTIFNEKIIEKIINYSKVNTK